MRSDQAPIVWLPQNNPRMPVLTGVVPGLFEGPTLHRLGPAIVREAPEGSYVELTAVLPRQQALIAGEASRASSIAIILPLDALFEDRVDAARRVWRAAVSGPTPPTDGFTAQRKRRLRLLIRALDAALLGVGYREIARGLFGDRVPVDAEWRTHPLRATTIRLVREGRALMRGGYLRLLRRDRRKR